jgi:16S rRNA (cytidine1402-2'-O)-methyltransferase
LAELAEWAHGDVRGEVTVVVEGAARDTAPPDADDLAAAVDALVTAGHSRRDAVDRVAAEKGLPRRVVYAAATGAR